MIDYSKLKSGKRLSHEPLILDADAVSAYTAAVGDASSPTAADGTPLVPPMAIAALALSAVINALRIPGGTIHAGQELDFNEAVPIGAALHCTSTLAQNSVRRGWRFLVINTEVTADSKIIMTGKSAIMLPMSD